MTNQAVAELIARSNRLGSDPKNTNYAGGNTSAKGTETDPVTGEPVELLWVKGSGGDLGTLTESGLAVLRLDRMRQLVNVYPGVEREDEMVAAFDYCLHGKGGAAPSIDTAMHGLVDSAHVDHLHPDSGIAVATAVDGEELTAKIFGDKVVWVPWRRPGFQLGLDIAKIKADNPQAIGCILGGHGITAWGDTSEECEANSLEIIRTAEAYIAEHSKPEPFGACSTGMPHCRTMSDGPKRPHSHRHCGRSPHSTSRWWGTSPMTSGCWSSCPVASIPGWPNSAPAARTTSCGPRSSRWYLIFRPTPRSRTASPGSGAPRGLSGRLPGVLRPPRNAGITADPGCRPVDHSGAGSRHVLLREGQADRPGGWRVLPERDQCDAWRGRAVDVPTDR